MKRITVLLAALCPLLASTASAQAFNVDVNHYPDGLTPSAAFGGAAGQPGFWDRVSGNMGTWALRDVNGNTTNVTLSNVSGVFSDNQHNHPLTFGDDERLMDDAAFLAAESSGDWVFYGLQPGGYTLYTYAWNPFPGGQLTWVRVNPPGGGWTQVGGSWNGTYTEGRTHAVNHFTLTQTGAVVVSIAEQGIGGVVNGFQIRPDVTGIVRCEPGVAGVLACPCNNNPNWLGRGCNNSQDTGGAGLGNWGVPSLAADSLNLTAHDERALATSVVLQGDSMQYGGLVFGQGLRCATGTLRRLYVLTSTSTGFVMAPPPGAPPISVRSAALGDTIGYGQSRWYVVYYRDPIVLGGCPAASTFNCTTTLEILWL